MFWPFWADSCQYGKREGEGAVGPQLEPGTTTRAEDLNPVLTCPCSACFPPPSLLMTWIRCSVIQRLEDTSWLSCLFTPPSLQTVSSDWLNSPAVSLVRSVGTRVTSRGHMDQQGQNSQNVADWKPYNLKHSILWLNYSQQIIWILV